MAGQQVPPVEPHRTCPKPFHPGGEIPLRRFDHQMEMISHQAKGVHLPGSLGARLGERGQEALAIGVIAKDVLAPVTAAEHVINRTGELQTEFTRHAATIRKGIRVVNTLD
jgi:hypothetical protein